MKALLLHGANDIRLAEIPEPAVGPGSIKVRITAAGICGTDLFLYRHATASNGTIDSAFGSPVPHVLGHEMAGIVTDLGCDVTGHTVGHLVAIFPMMTDGTCAACLTGREALCTTRSFMGIHQDGGFAEYVVVPDDHAYRVHHPFDAETAALVEPMATCWHAMAAAALSEHDVAVIVGAGPIGLGLLLCLKATGVQTVIVSEPLPERRALAKRLGATVLDPTVTDLPSTVQTLAGQLAAAVFDTAGVSNGVVADELAALALGGTLFVMAEFSTPVAVDFQNLVTTGKRIEGVIAYGRSDFEAVICAVHAGQLDLRALVTSRVPLNSAVDQGIERLIGEGRRTEVKILVCPE